MCHCYYDSSAALPFSWRALLYLPITALFTGPFIFVAGIAALILLWRSPKAGKVRLVMAMLLAASGVGLTTVATDQLRMLMLASVVIWLILDECLARSGTTPWVKRNRYLGWTALIIAFFSSTLLYLPIARPDYFFTHTGHELIKTWVLYPYATELYAYFDRMGLMHDYLKVVNWCPLPAT
jgi:magnesium-transporting ATPase (P-type)